MRPSHPTVAAVSIRCSGFDKENVPRFPGGKEVPAVIDVNTFGEHKVYCPFMSKDSTQCKLSDNRTCPYT
jgi:hypothetical protein